MQYVFGGGKNKWIPRFWIAFFGVFLIFYGMIHFTSFQIITNIAIFVELIVNIDYGYKFCEKQKFVVLLMFYHDKYHIPIEKQMKYFNNSIIALLVILGLLILLCTLEAFVSVVGVYSWAYLVVLYIMFLVFYIVVLGSSILLCLIWCLQLYVVKRAIERLKELISPSCLFTTLEEIEKMHLNSIQSTVTLANNIHFITSIPTEHLSRLRQMSKEEHASSKKESHSYTLHINLLQLETALFTFLLEMRAISNDWKINHIFRAVTGLIIGLQYLMHSMVMETVGDYFGLVANIFTVILYFSAIWLTALLAGYVNDLYFRSVLYQLTRFYSEDDRITYKENQEILGIITKLSAMRQIEGLHYAGMSMSLEKAFGIGSLLVSIVVVIIRFFAFHN
jgi:hypothetical protein